MLKQVNPAYIKTDVSHEMYDTIHRVRVRTLATCMGDINAASLIAILLAENVASPVVVAVGLDFLVAFAVSDINLPRLQRVGISNVVCVILLRYIVKTYIFSVNIF